MSRTLSLSPVVGTAGSHKATRALGTELTLKMIWEVAIVGSADLEEGGAQKWEMGKRDLSHGSKSNC